MGRTNGSQYDAKSFFVSLPSASVRWRRETQSSSVPASITLGIPQHVDILKLKQFFMADMSTAISLAAINAGVLEVEKLSVRRVYVSSPILVLICVENSGNTNLSHSLSDAPESRLPSFPLVWKSSGVRTINFFFPSCATKLLQSSSAC